jgi:nitroreductase
MSMPPQASDRLSMPLGDAIFSLRAIRRFKSDALPEEDIRTILEAAIHAPNGGNAQPWRFLMLRDPELRAKFATLYREAWWAKRHDEGINGPQDIPLENRSSRAAMRLADEFGQAPIIVFVCATAKGAGAMGSVIPAVQNLLLAARSLGIGGTITTLHAVVDERVRALLGIPDSAQIVYCIPLGYPRGRFGPTTRKPLEAVAALDRWDGAAP